MPNEDTHENHPPAYLLLHIICAFLISLCFESLNEGFVSGTGNHISHTLSNEIGFRDSKKCTLDPRKLSPLLHES